MSMFDPIDPRQSFPALEHGILQYWKEEDTFKRSVKQRVQHDTFSFYDGPPFATGLPHYGHLLTGTIKDVIPRYQTMRGKKVERRFGWDCHGLPIENLVEQENGIKNKQEIEERGVKWFNDLCRGSVQRYTSEWRKTVERMGRWVDMDWDYRTMDPDYMESMWWAFKELYKKNFLYEGYKAMHICTRCETPLSNFEVTQSYSDRTDMSVIMTFPLKDDPQTILLAWTTTPWSLPGNFWLAVGKDISYVRVRSEGKTYIVAEKLVATIFKDRDHEVFGSIDPNELVGRRYEPLFPYFTDRIDPATQESGNPQTLGERVFTVVMYDDVAVSDEEGTGIVHITSCLGEDSYAIARHEGIGVDHHLGINGLFYDFVTDFAGMSAKPEGDDPMATDKAIIANLKDRGRHFDSFPITHSYPHCWRCESPLLNYATSSWFIAVEKIKTQMLRNKDDTEWMPAYIRDGRFGNWLRDAHDWAISRNRYWGTPLPIWRCEETGEIEVIGSRDELMSKAPERFTKVTAIRHAESEGNIIPIYQGAMPGTNLTQHGRKQAKEAGKILKGQGVTVMYVSPLARAQQTARIIAKYIKAEVITDDRICEINFGEFEGKTIDFSDLTFVKDIRAKKIEKGKPESIYHFEGMETWKESQKRVNEFFAEILPQHKGQHIVVVSHADPVNNIRHLFTKEDPVKISHQPYPEKCRPYTFFWDHETRAQMDLHKETADSITWKTAGGGVMKRIPEVADCWFESGSMPYAQIHFPFEGDATVPPDLPADFIAEGLDQTRTWFYTLMVLSTALFGKTPYKHVVVNGIVLAEDGKKMSKRLKNYPEPSEVVEKFGADAIRFMLMSSPAVRGENLRVSERLIEEQVRRVMLPLWNSYGFFVLHANEAQWEPVQVTNDVTRHSPLVQHHPLDLWIKAEVQDLVNRMTAELDHYDLSATCAELYQTLDALTNWYIRRSRRRFAGKEGDAERDAALDTLHEVLLTFCKVLAPFCPFITEAIYLNLEDHEHGSIHLSDWPETRALTREEKEMIEKTRLLRTIVSLGMGLRAEANVKVRQPLSKAEIVLPTFNFQSSACNDEGLSSEDKDILAQELNVKEIVLLKDASHLADRIVQIDARKVGPRLGNKIQELIKAAKDGDFTENKNGTITVLGEKLSGDEARVVYRGKEDQAVASERGIVMRLDTNISEALTLEGLARDIVRAVQTVRKEKGLQIADRITLQAGEGVALVLDHFRTFIEEETNASFEPLQGAKLSVKVGISDGKAVITV